MGLGVLGFGVLGLGFNRFRVQDVGLRIWGADATVRGAKHCTPRDPYI